MDLFSPYVASVLYPILEVGKGVEGEKNNFKDFLFVLCVDPCEPPLHPLNVLPLKGLCSFLMAKLFILRECIYLELERTP